MVGDNSKPDEYTTNGLSSSKRMMSWIAAALSPQQRSDFVGPRGFASCGLRA